MTPEEQETAAMMAAALRGEQMRAQRDVRQADVLSGIGGAFSGFGDEAIDGMSKSMVQRGQSLRNSASGSGLLEALARRRQVAEKGPEELDAMEALAADRRSKTAARGVPKPPKDTSTKDAGDMRKELNGNPVTKAAQDAAVAWSKIQTSAKDPSAAGDLALIFNFMKTLDPGSTVREGEFANAQNAGGVDSKIAAQYNQVISGQRLAPGQRADFLKRAKEAFGAHTTRYRQLSGQYGELAKRKGLNPADVVLDMGFDAPVEGGSFDRGGGDKAAARKKEMEELRKQLAEGEGAK